MPRNFKLTIEYDGGGFHGWQVQPDCRTVQGELIKAAEELSTRHVRVVGAGRTDAGVHATGQVANVVLETRLDPQTVMRALNARLPRDVLLRSIEEVPLDFNARFDARSRTYQYLFLRKRTALWRNRFLEVPYEIDLRAMRAELDGLMGEKDFSSFASREEESRNKRCYVMSADLVESGPIVIFSIKADHFLHKMVRTIAGTLLEIGRGKPLDIGEVVAARDRSASGPTLPPHALYLVKVDY